MHRLMEMTDEIAQEILDFLYTDEIMNVFLIHYFENQREQLGDVYVRSCENKLSDIVHIKYDGNAHFTSFYSTTDAGLREIADRVRALNHRDILLAGKDEEVRCIMNRLGIEKELYLNTYYRFNVENHHGFEYKEGINLRRATRSGRDMERVKAFLIGFFEAETEEDRQSITCDKKIEEEMDNGIYLLEVNEAIVGMARYFGKSSRYMDITTVYIDEQYRGKGYGKVLMQLMVEQAIGHNKVPITQTALSNRAAKHVYESMGFESVCSYTFQFIK